MKRITFIPILLSFLFLGCGKDDGKEEDPLPVLGCGKDDGKIEEPLPDLPWLKEIINDRVQEEMTGMYMNIYQCTYNNSIDGFYIEPCYNCHNYTAYLASYDGVVLDDFSGTIGMRKFHEKWNIKNKKLIWTNIK